jgi:cell division protein FtsB
MRILAGILGILILLLQYPLWLGKGGWLRAWQLDQEVSRQKDRNQGLELRNTGLAAEVRDLKTGTEAIEERARSELGMLRSGEVFYQYDDTQSATSGSKNSH